jgi:hypothetical protein
MTISQHLGIIQSNYCAFDCETTNIMMNSFFQKCSNFHKPTVNRSDVIKVLWYLISAYSLILKTKKESGKWIIWMKFPAFNCEN